MKIEILQDQLYDFDNDLHLDVYKAPSDKNLGSILYIHGGGLFMGKKDNSNEPATYLAENGYSVIVPNYSKSTFSSKHHHIILASILLIFLLLASTTSSKKQTFLILIIMCVLILTLISVWALLDRDDVKHPQHVQDVSNAFKWIEDNAFIQNFNTENMYIMGHSAGGYIASILSTNNFFLESVQSSTSKIKGTIAISGFYSDQRLKESVLGKELLHTAFGKKTSYYNEFPIYNIHVDNTPPFLLLNAGYDITLKSHSYDFHYALRNKGVYSKIDYFKDVNHFTIMKNWKGKNKQVPKTILEFMKNVVP